MTVAGNNRGVPFTVVFCPGKLFIRGARFNRQEFSVTLKDQGWPENMVVRDTRSGWWYEVKYEDGKSALVALDGSRRLVPVRGGNGLALE